MTLTPIGFEETHYFKDEARRVWFVEFSIWDEVNDTLLLLKDGGTEITEPIEQSHGGDTSREHAAKIIEEHYRPMLFRLESRRARARRC